MPEVPFYSLDQQKFEELIADSGKLVTWQAGYRCSCWVVSSGSPNYNCRACGGFGYIYQPPATATVLMSGIDVKKEFLPAGEWRLGDITCTVPNRVRRTYPLVAPAQGTGVAWDPNPMWTIGEADLVTLPDSEQRTSEILTRGQPLWLRPADTLLHTEAILSILSLSVSDPVSGSIKYFTPGALTTDYTLSGSVVTWLPASVKDFAVIGSVVSFNPNGTNAKTLLTGQQYSITYTHLTTYIVYQALPQPRDQYGQKFPRKVVLRLRGVNLK